MKRILIKVDEETYRKLQRMKDEGKILTKSDFIRGVIKETYARFFRE